MKTKFYNDSMSKVRYDVICPQWTFVFYGLNT